MNDNENFDEYQDNNNNNNEIDWTTLLDGLNSDDETFQIQSLLEICNHLCILTEDNLKGFDPYKFLPILVTRVKESENPDILVYSCRSILHITEIYSYFTPIENHQVVEALCERIQSIEYIDFAELIIRTLVIYSDYRNLAIRIIRSGGLNPLIMYLDFFSNDIQLKSIEIVSNTLKYMTLELYESVEPIIPSLCVLLFHHNVKIVEHVTLSFYHISSSFSSFNKDLNIIIESGALSQLNELLLTYSMPPNNGISVIINAIKTMQFYLNDKKCFIYLHNLNIPLSIHQILNSDKEGYIKMDAHHIYQVVMLLNSLLPDIPLLKDTNDHKNEYYNENPKKLHDLMNYFLHHLITISEKTTSQPLISICLSIISKMVLLSSKDVLVDVLADISFSHFIASIFGSKKADYISIVIDICFNLMEKLHDIFFDIFIKEGVVFELNQFIESYSKQSDNNKLNQDSKEDGNKVQSNPIESILKKANDFKNKYFNQTVKPTKALELLNHSKNRLEELFNEEFNEDEVKKVFLKIIESLQLGISTYELIESGLVDQLYNFFTANDLTKSNRKVILERLKLFVDTFSQGNALIAFLNELHNYLDKIEDFQLENLESQDNLKIKNLRYLSKQFRIKCKLKDDTNNRYLDIYLGPLTSVKQLKTIIQTKVRYEEYYYPPQDQPDDYHNDNYDPHDDFNDLIDDQNDYIDDVVDLFTIHTSEYEQNSSHDIKLTDSSSSISKLLLSSTPSEEYPNDNQTEKPQRVNLYFNDIEIGDDLNLFQMVHLIQKIKDGNECHYFSQFWSKSYELIFTLTPIDSEDDNNNNISLNKSEDNIAYDIHDVFFSNPIDLFMLSPKNEFKQKNNKVNHALNLIKLIRVLCDCNITFNLSKDLFLNKKLTSKITLYVNDVLSTCTHTIPSWMPLLIQNNKHLFPYDVRCQFFRSTSLGVSRSMLNVKESIGEIAKNRLGRLHRKKVRINRDKILQSFISITKLMKNSSSLLEIEYFDEVATGLGPTLEFFTLLSKEFQKKELKLWIDSCNDHSQPFINAKNGLFPLPMSKLDNKEREKTLSLYKSFGYFIAKAIYDNRLVDIFLSSPLICFLLGEPVNIYMLKEIYPDVLNVIESFKSVIEEKRMIESNNDLTDIEKRNNIMKLKYNNVSIEDLSLYFVLPGYNLEIIENGSDKLVTIDNLELYVDKIIQFLLKDSIEDQVKAIREGFNCVFDISSLKLFNPYEINMIIGGSLDQKWDKQVILENIKCDHGYTINSHVVQYIVEIMSEFNIDERRKCLQFLTGSPCLPYRGFKGFNPRLTIVRKEADPPLKADDYLPSVNTCFLYLKVPEYSSKEVTREKFIQAIENGQTGFSLS